MAKAKKKITLSVTRYYVRVMAFTVLGMVIGAFVMSHFVSAPVVYAPISETVNEVETISENAHVPSLTQSLPVQLVIPKINLDTTFVAPLGLNADQTVSVPNSFTEVGWYNNGVTPGEIGPAVILGHVDSKDGPAVFYSLGQLKVGDEVQVEREDGTVAAFIVKSMERVPQDEFPTERVYGNIEYAGLRLVTCTGIYNRGAMRYSHNLIVYAELKGSE